ncbi:MAG: hypothetical protein NTX59_11375 [Elusimicrobia bacterium]|nr:hypothetical protein [Elusimicrobiota bacterium]
MRGLKNLIILAVILAVPGISAAADLTAQGISILDGNGNSRATFSNTESLILRQQVRNDTLSKGMMIRFKFFILNPAGAVVFTHTGNAAPGTPGTAQTQISGISIPSFYNVPGVYVYRAEADLDTEIVVQEVKFTISSPNITLIYPPYGAKGLSDKPLIFRWIASGASRYRITVSDNAGLYNPAHQGVNSGEGFYTYPETSTQPREELVPEQVYYWKIEGLDAAGNKLSESDISNFSLKSQVSSQTRDVAVSALETTTPENDFKKPMNFKATLSNTGSTNETNITAKLTLGGLPAQDSPKQVAFINAGEKKEIPFTAFVPDGQDTALAVACIDLFDDNIPDNCKTLLISRNIGLLSGTSNGASGGGAKEMTFEEMYDAILQKLGPDALNALDGYTFESIACPNCAQGELGGLVQSLTTGDAGISNASLEGAAQAAQPGTGQGTAPAQPSEDAAAGYPDEPDLELAGKLSPQEMYYAILLKLGPDALNALEGYTFESIICADCAQGELVGLVQSLMKGQAGISNASIEGTAQEPQSAAGQITAPAQPSEDAAAGYPDEPDLNIPGAKNPQPHTEATEQKTGTDIEWSGFSEALPSDEGRTYAIRTKKDWQEVWKLLSNENTPEIDFNAKTIIGIITGRKDRAETVRLLGRRTSDEGIVFDYYVVEVPKDTTTMFSAYVFRAVDKLTEKVEFKRLDVSKQQ